MGEKREDELLQLWYTWYTPCKVEEQLRLHFVLYTYTLYIVPRGGEAALALSALYLYFIYIVPGGGEAGG